jgi:hypothetical protein
MIRECREMTMKTDGKCGTTCGASLRSGRAGSYGDMMVQSYTVSQIEDQFADTSLRQFSCSDSRTPARGRREIRTSVESERGHGTGWGAAQY